jgi:myo-inositol-1(or 4)-monophosphatase
MRLRAETHAALDAARAGGRILNHWFGRVGPVRLKGPRDPVTRADGLSERAIRRLLHRRFPAIGFLGEEGGVVATGPHGRWIVDPLDGTIAFVAGLPTFGVSIALERRGRLEVGVMLNGRRIRVSRTTEMARCVVSLWHEAALWRDHRMRSRVARVGAEVRSVAMVGACFSLAYVAAGRLDAYWERQAHPWDVAAGALLVREAGGRVTGGAGQPFDVDEPSIVASNGRIHDRIVAILNGRRAPARRTR